MFTVLDWFLMAASVSVGVWAAKFIPILVTKAASMAQRIPADE